MRRSLAYRFAANSGLVPDQSFIKLLSWQDKEVLPRWYIQWPSSCPMENRCLGRGVAVSTVIMARSLRPIIRAAQPVKRSIDNKGTAVLSDSFDVDIFRAYNPQFLNELLGRPKIVIRCHGFCYRPGHPARQEHRGLQGSSLYLHPSDLLGHGAELYKLIDIAASEKWQA